MRLRLAVSALSLLAVAAAAAPAGAQTSRATESVEAVDRPTPIAADRSTVVWSRWDDARRVYVLRARIGRSPAFDVPVASRSVPFDASVARMPIAGRTRTVLLYSRCREEPSLDDRSLPVWPSARGCDIHRFVLHTRVEERLGGVSTDESSEFLPAAHGSFVAFGRVFETRVGKRGELPYLYVRRVSGGRSARLPGGPRGDTGRPGPTNLTVRRGRVAFVWQYRAGDEGIRSAVRLDEFDHSGGRLRAGAHRVIDQGASGEALSTDELLGASFAGSRLYWGETCAGDTAGCNARERLHRYAFMTDDHDRASAPAYLLGHAFSDVGAYVVRSLYGLQARLQNPCNSDDLASSDPAAGRCRIERLAQPGYR